MISRLHLPLLEPEDVVLHLGQQERHWKAGRSAHALSTLWSRNNAIPQSIKSILATQKADVLRRDLAPDETYLLARGPAEENALLYLVVPPSLMAATKSIPELSQAMITARVRTGRSELVGVPILDLVTITSRK